MFANTKKYIFLSFAFVGAVGIVCDVARVLIRRRKTYNEIIEPILKQYGFEYVDSTTPSFLNVGPFPKVELEIGGTFTRTLIGQGEYTQYRIVKLFDHSKKVREAWVKISVEAFRLRDVQ